MALSKDQKRYWEPITQVTQWLVNHVIKPTDVVLDIGCGHRPFPRANIGIDRYSRETLESFWTQYNNPNWLNTMHGDAESEPLPFGDKEIDFVFCRHTLEDMCNPFFALDEMQRVAKAGYIETPSPLVELARGVDGFENSYLWRGYYHHRFFVWVKKGRLTFVSKFPVIEYFSFNDEVLEDLLSKGPELWNTYYLWKDEIQYDHLEDPFDFKFRDEYRSVLWNSVQESTDSTMAFGRMVSEQSRQAA